MADFLVAGTVLTLLGVSSYPFAQRETLIWLGWIFVVSAVAIMLLVVTSLNRDRVISLLAGTDPGRLSLTGDLALRVGMYGLVPIMALLGASFPEAVQRVLSPLSALAGTH